MGRLIDADLLKDKFTLEQKIYDVGQIWDEINDMPTAYDVDKVVEQISHIKESVAKNIRLCSQEDDIEREVKYSAYPYDKCIEIVKGAVKDE